MTEPCWLRDSKSIWSLVERRIELNKLQLKLLSEAMDILEGIYPWGPEITEAHGILASLYYKKTKEFNHAKA